jgi:hypothetical protein
MAMLMLGVLAGCGSGSKGSPVLSLDGAAPLADAPVLAPDAPSFADLAPVSPDLAAAIDPALGAQAMAIAAEYQGWGRVDDELRWAPFLCRIPLPGVARPSESMDGDTHGQKLYSVFVKKRDAYPAGPHTGQVVVKQSWIAEKVTGAVYEPQKQRDYPDGGDHFYPYAQKGTDLYRASAPAGLYIMFRLDPATPNTDEGWVYATITAAGQLTAAGRVASCMGCHLQADHDRLFGVPRAP